MADAANKYAENVAGKFYVDDQCIDFINGQIDLRRSFFLLVFNFLLRKNYG